MNTEENLSMRELQLRYSELLQKYNLDDLTGVYRRRYMETLVERTLVEPGMETAFVMLDINNFKQVNDQQGHVNGDKILVWFAELLKYYFGDQGIVGRLGGDEFCVFLPTVSDRQVTEKFSRGFLKTLKEARLDEFLPRVGCAIGVSFSGEFPGDFMKMYDQADRAMYQAKKMGSGCAVYGKEI